MYLLFGVRADTLVKARVLVEDLLGIQLYGREGLHNGGEYFRARLPDYSLKLRENIDLDDIEREAHGLEEPDFPEFTWLLYVDGIDDRHPTLRVLEQKTDILKMLRAVD